MFNTCLLSTSLTRLFKNGTSFIQLVFPDDMRFSFILPLWIKLMIYCIFQVRFKVVSDCIPLPESQFKKAIKENYNNKNKFKTELTHKQVNHIFSWFSQIRIILPTHFHLSVHLFYYAVRKGIQA